MRRFFIEVPTMTTWFLSQWTEQWAVYPINSRWLTVLLWVMTGCIRVCLQCSKAWSLHCAVHFHCMCVLDLIPADGCYSIALYICWHKCYDLLILCFQSWEYRGGDRKLQVNIWLWGWCSGCYLSGATFSLINPAIMEANKDSTRQ